MKDLLIAAERGIIRDPDMLAELLAGQGEAHTALLAAADRVRREHVGDGVHLRGIVEFSNRCRRNCLYCGIRASNPHVQRYRMLPEEIVETAIRASHLGFGTIVLQSGEGDALDPSELAWVVTEIRARTPLAITLSVGERSREDYALWRRAGADRFLLRHETSDPDLFARLRPGCRLEDRLQCLAWLRELGYQVGSGFMVGLPGQDLGSLARDILLLCELGVEMAGIGPFLPHPDTPLADAAGGKLDLTLRVIAATRLLLPDCHIPATTALGSVHPRGRQLALHAGANVVMPNVTPTRFRQHYALYPQKICLFEDAERCHRCAVGWIIDEGRFVASGPGHAVRRAAAGAPVRAHPA